MKLAGFNFTKINVEKKKDSFKELKIDTKIDLLDLKEINSSLKSKDSFIGISFNYEISYNPDLALIGFKGNILLALDSKQAKDILKDWKEKKISEEFRLLIFNLILRKANIKAIQLEEELNLPLHFQLPSISSSATQKKK
jgi:hypothetical protein